MKSLLMWLLRAYRLAISPLFPPRCRFLPSCSDYALQAVDRHGALAGGWLAMRRFVRCNPLNPGGVDEVPDNPGGPFARRSRTDGKSRTEARSRYACLCQRPVANSGHGRHAGPPASQ